ncbi:helix-turn-helix domain-containing protein [Chenggangzhangella methanolivorans]|uniref:helix-turn-helix domain-containing protein n=1 Tax=Chenggangzhangella methanolivorans TaxID=1437009 RepID=UPI0021BD5C8E|nr:helix-turn-helix transcriptional regulator [Chenggangzhangella methanolivorans]
MTLDQLAELASSSKSYIWELENKNPPRPSADKIAKIAAVLGVTSDYCFMQIANLAWRPPRRGVFSKIPENGPFGESEDPKDDPADR